MATVSEIAWESIGRIDFCACCGLRRELGSLNLRLSEGNETVRCIDCFFGPPEPRFTFQGTAVYRGQNTPIVCFGQTGDLLWDGGKTWFEPHGDLENRFFMHPSNYYAVQMFSPKRYSVVAEIIYD